MVNYIDLESHSMWQERRQVLLFSGHATKGQFMVVPLGSLSNSEADKVQGSHADTLVEVSGLEPPTSTMRT